MALPAEPRQKMINLMYLVLTAMLALNVSAEILNAFKTVDRSLTTTNTAINNSTETVIKSFEDKLAEPESRAKAELWMPKAQQAVQATASLNTYINTLKQDILKAAGFDPAKNGDSTFKEDDQDVATRLMVKEGRGKQLRDRLDQYKKQIAGLSPELATEVNAFLRQINLDIPPSTTGTTNRTWEGTYFDMVPTVAAITMLSKFQNDIKTTENRVVSLFHEQVGKVVVRYDAFAAIVGQSSNYIMPGQEIEVSAGVGAFSRAARPQISINGQGVEIGPEGQASLKVGGGALGKHSIPVVIRFQDQDGNMQTVTKNVEYTVGQANASIALDKMNVLYIGVDNPITIAASGGGDDRVQATITGGGGSLTKVGNGKYIAKVTTRVEDCRITVSIDGKVAGVSQFRVRPIPDPVATVGGYASGENVPAGAFKAQAGVGAYIKDFPFELKYSVVGFTLTADTDDGDVAEAVVSGNSWNTPQAQQIVRGLKAGRLVTIDNIRAQGPDGRSRKLPSLVYYIK